MTNKPDIPLFNVRPTVKIKLPLSENTSILFPEQVILTINRRSYDYGAFCYAIKSAEARKSNQPQLVVISSFLTQRPKQLLGIILLLSSFITEGGLSLTTVAQCSARFLNFMWWADSNNLHNCLNGGEDTRNAFKSWSDYIGERYRKNLIEEDHHNRLLRGVAVLLEAATGLEDLMTGIRLVKKPKTHLNGTEPLSPSDFIHVVALNQAVFDGLCDLVLENRPFPYRLKLPASLNSTENYRWLFPTNRWQQSTYQLNETGQEINGKSKLQIYDYKNGRLRTAAEVQHTFNGKTQSERLNQANKSIRRAQANLDRANSEAINTWRYMLASIAQRAFLFIFICNTGGNLQVVRDLEWDGTIDKNVKNQKFRALKWRAQGKEVTLVAPVSFMPRLRRFVKLRQMLLQNGNTPFFFVGTGNRNNKAPGQIGVHDLDQHYRQVLLKFDPGLPKVGARKLRASVADYYNKYHDNLVTATVLGNTLKTVERSYDLGSANDHHEEMTTFMNAVSESASRQRVDSAENIASDRPLFEEGGICNNFGHPEPLSVTPPVEPNCKNLQGCLFCTHRILIASEEDARKVASAAYVMDKLIIGPKHEEALRPSIAKCDQDLAKIAEFPGCNEMVERVRRDVYENENLTAFWADKYQLFLELGVLS